MKVFLVFWLEFFWLGALMLGCHSQQGFWLSEAAQAQAKILVEVKP